jgi:hypothetical protein
MNPQTATPPANSSIGSILFFDKDVETDIVQRRNLPHWGQPGVLCFIAWRTADSLPRQVIQNWTRDRDVWLSAHGINLREADWRKQVASLPRREQQIFRAAFSDEWEDQLDGCHGECVLRRPELSAVVADSLHHFDGERNLLTDFVVMPNHVHVLASFPGLQEMLAQCDSWKHFTATKINRALGRRGRFWEVDDFDHLVRNDLQYEWFRRYIAENPRKAKLVGGEYCHFSKKLDS